MGKEQRRLNVIFVVGLIFNDIESNTFSANQKHSPKPVARNKGGTGKTKVAANRSRVIKHTNANIGMRAHANTAISVNTITRLLIAEIGLANIFARKISGLVGTRQQRKVRPMLEQKLRQWRQQRRKPKPIQQQEHGREKEIAGCNESSTDIRGVKTMPCIQLIYLQVQWHSCPRRRMH